MNLFAEQIKKNTENIIAYEFLLFQDILSD